ncbi:MAG TPA: amidohydrolase family protein [Puia sp.]|nr:amidohydrolase family protein [Puia sp.]
MRLNDLRMPGGQGLTDLVIAKEKIVAVLPHGEPGGGGRGGGGGRVDRERERGGRGREGGERGRADRERERGGRGRERGGSEKGISCEGALVFAGLINSHDHLDFNLFPPLANRVYASYREWGPDIQANRSEVIREVMKVPLKLRVAWGVYKNLLNGFTTVVNHGALLPVDDTLIDVFQRCHCLHSVGFDKYWKWKLNRPLARRRPFVLHVGEGTDAAASEEIGRLIRGNFFRRPVIGVHGVAMQGEQASAFRALVWCPASNYFLLNRTAPVASLKTSVPILFGTDSTLTGSWNAWQQIRQARREQALTDGELLATLTTAPALAWGLRDRGQLVPGKLADLVIARPKPRLRGMDAFFGLDPEDLLLVMRAGRPLLFDAGLREALIEAGLNAEEYRAVGSGRIFVRGNLPGLLQAIRSFYPGVEFPAAVTA